MRHETILSPNCHSSRSRLLVLSASKSPWDADDALEYLETVGLLLEINRIRRIVVTWRLIVAGRLTDWQNGSSGNEFARVSRGAHGPARPGPVEDSITADRVCIEQGRLVISPRRRLIRLTPPATRLQPDQSNVVYRLPISPLTPKSPPHTHTLPSEIPARLGQIYHFIVLSLVSFFIISTLAKLLSMIVRQRPRPMLRLCLVTCSNDNLLLFNCLRSWNNVVCCSFS